MEIGNENGGPTYEEHYKLFYDAIKAKYPEMHLVAERMTRPGPVDILDEHYYSNPEFFMANADQYDKYDRDGAQGLRRRIRGDGELPARAICGRPSARRPS